MKKVLAVVALLLIATPVFAGTTVRLVPEGANFDANGTKQQTVRCEYQTDVDIAAFALDINMNAVGNTSTFDSIRDFNVGESDVATKRGYGIFPSRFRDFITPLNGSQVDTGDGGWADSNYTPLTAWNEPGAQLTGIGFNTMVAELGTLYAGDGNKPALSGTLFRFDVNSEKYVGTFPLAIAADALRGGVVDKNAAGVTATFVGTNITFTGGLVAVPNVVTMDRVAARAAIVAAGLTVGVEANVAPTAGGQAVRTINDQKPAAATMVAPGSIVDINAVSYPVKYMTATGSLYVNWVARNRPACWAYPRQCKGGADGKKQISYWVGSNNLTILKAAFNKAESVFTNGGVSGTTSLICASFDHKKQISYWVGSNNLAVLKANFNKAESAIPVCGTIPTASKGFSTDPNYWYFCVPTGATCPTGVYCAPVAICPNTP